MLTLDRCQSPKSTAARTDEDGTSLLQPNLLQDDSRNPDEIAPMRSQGGGPGFPPPHRGAAGAVSAGPNVALDQGATLATLVSLLQEPLEHGGYEPHVSPYNRNKWRPTWPSSQLSTIGQPMKLVRTLLASAALAASLGANATVVGSAGGGNPTFAALSGPALCGLTVLTQCSMSGAITGTIQGGTTYSSDQGTADIPKGTVGNFLAAGPTSTNPANLTFGTALTYVSFLWGSPDTYNTLTVFSNGGTTSQVFHAADFGFTTVGDQAFSRYAQFTATAGSITGIRFDSAGTDAFEVSNFSVTAVPEPETYALMLAGLGALGFIARRRKVS